MNNIKVEKTFDDFAITALQFTLSNANILLWYNSDWSWNVINAFALICNIKSIQVNPNYFILYMDIYLFTIANNLSLTFFKIQKYLYFSFLNSPFIMTIQLAVRI